ncbi:ATP phosphoribosyltransferase [Thiococcus pfennigii]|jgi:ATP phosphoribosyltransferase|uniref:ATP phosphoribosyltransferase n=1 Tax=Thiococcus pfennigii TaxID=1057 RepID=UPI001905087F|nr:ATP phosphoribosyltransferase [Thiococcus pfennigii]MBK1699348.1 ATP phosphoribosyltransferase [Thiococcus pfennigii]MBK1730923.1 ATP phosphoribosyltransferase [Thiococcus pfennigii]
MSLIKLGIPKGSLEEATINLFGQAGWQIKPRSRHYYPEVDDPELSCALVRAQEMAPYVANGTLDLGLTGLDWILETQAEVVEICALTYSKSSNQPSRWVLVVPQDSPVRTVKDLEGKKVATELVGFTRRHLAEQGVAATVEFSWGATEAKVVEGLVDAAVEITETGSTIRAHGLRIVADLLYTETRLIANPAAMDDPAKRTKIEQIATMLQAALAARHKVVLKLNVAAGDLDAVVALLPSLHAPTVSHLYDGRWLAVETVVDAQAVRDLIPRLRAAGAEGILEFELRKMV